MVPVNWEQFVLLLIDVQNDFWPTEVAADFPEFENNVSKLLQTCRTNGIDVVHVHARFQQDKSDWMNRYKIIDRRLPCIEGTEGVELLKCATPVKGESVIYKQTFDAFYKPELTEYLQQNNKRFIFVAGLITSVCVLLTASSAAQSGYLVAVLEDCCADSAAAHEHTLANYPFVFDVVNSREILGQYEHWQGLLTTLKQS